MSAPQAQAHVRPRHAHTLPATPTDFESLSDVEHDHDQGGEHEHEAHGDEPWLFRLLNRAAAFADVISQHHHAHAEHKEVSGAEHTEAGVDDEAEAEAETEPDVMCILGHDLARMGLPTDEPSPAVESEREHEHGTAGTDPTLDPLSQRRTAESTESTWCHSAPHRWTLLSASSWLKKRRGGLAGDRRHGHIQPGEEEGEDEGMVSEDEGKGRTEHEEIRGLVRSPPPAPLIQPVEDAPRIHPPLSMTEDTTHVPAVASPMSIADSTYHDSVDSEAVAADSAADPPALSDAQKVALIVEEFGAIAQGEDEETLLAETDASFFQDVAILGVLHLTTHRIAFHASLLSARPDLAPTAQVLHAGPAVVGMGKGGRGGKRVWMELNHDMITTFRSSDDHARVRPLRTVLLSAFRKIHPIDPRHPRRVTLDFETAAAESRKGTTCGKKGRKSNRKKGRKKGKQDDRKREEKEERKKKHAESLPAKSPSLSLGRRRPWAGSGSSPGTGTEEGTKQTHVEGKLGRADTDVHKGTSDSRVPHAVQQEGSYLPSPAPSPGSPASIASSLHSSPSSIQSDSEDDSDPDRVTHDQASASTAPFSDPSHVESSPVKITTDTVEFDTEEAALGWRREVQAALFLYRCQRGRGRGRKQTQTHSHVAEGIKGWEEGDSEGEDVEPDQDEGVRISIPLRRIQEHTIHTWENLATILQMNLGRTSLGEGEFGEGVGADIDFGVGEEILKRARERTEKGEGYEWGIKGTEKRRKGSATERTKETGLKRAGSGFGLKRGSSVKEEDTTSAPDPSKELLATAGPLTRGWESPRTELGTGFSKDNTTAASEHAQTSSFKLQFALLRANVVWSRLGEHIAHVQAAPGEESEIIVDFGPLTFVEPGLDVDVGRGKAERGIGSAGGGSAEGDVVKCSREREVRRIFGLEDMDIWITKCSLTRTISTSGLLAISKRFICFWSRLFAASDVKLRFPTADVRDAISMPKGAHARCHRGGMALQIYGQENVVFEFSRESARDEAVRKVRDVLVTREQSPSSSVSPRLGAAPLRPSATLPMGTMRPHAQGSPLRPAMSTPVSLHSSSLTSSINTESTSSKSFSSAPERVSSPPSTLLSSTPSEDTLPPSQAPAHPPTTSLLSPLSRTVAQLRGRTLPPAALVHLAKPINVPPLISYGIAHRHFVILTIGSRGDVQPYIALTLGLRDAGHKVTIVTHGEYKEWIEKWGIEHRPAGGDPGALMKLNVNHKMFSPQFFKESISHFRTWIDELLVEAWEQCKDADVLIESPPAMAGVHIAEALNIPYFRAFTMPWSRTAQYPHPFISPPVENSARFNVASYVLFDNVFWIGTSGQINRWRKKRLGLRPTDMGHLAQAKIPFLYNFSPTVVPKPLDWGDQITITGYWFLDNPELNWTPSEALLQFITRARAEAKPLVYIGFGSITVPRPRAMTRSIVKAVLKSDVRAILSKGWSSRMDKDTGPEIELPPEIHLIDTVPHDWLFPQIDAALHHGGAGSTGASLRAGIPTLIKPWFGDQFFWASRVQRLGAGLRVASLHSADLADALKRATTDRIMVEKAAAIGQRIRQEAGVPVAIQAIYTYLDRAGKDRTTLKD